MNNRHPDFRLKALDKLTEIRGEVGAGWQNEDGSISIRLDPWTILESNPNLLLTLFPVEKTEKKK